MSGPRFSIIPGDFIDDSRATLIHYQVLTQLGRRTNKAGWCIINQTKLAGFLGVVRQTVNKAVSDLVAWGYVEKKGQQVTGRNICYYRVILDRGDPLAGPRNMAAEIGVEDAGDEDDDDAMAANSGIDNGGDVSCTGDTGVSSTHDTSVASRDDTSVASGSDTLTYPLNNDPPHTTKTRAARRGVCVADFLDDLKIDGRNGHVVAFLFVGLAHLPVRNSEHPAGAASLLAMRDDLASHSDMALAKAALALRGERSVMPSGAIVRKSVIAAEGPMLTIRQGEDGWDAWLAYDTIRGNPTVWIKRECERRAYRRQPPDLPAPSASAGQPPADWKLRAAGDDG